MQFGTLAALGQMLGVLVPALLPNTLLQRPASRVVAAIRNAPLRSASSPPGFPEPPTLWRIRAQSRQLCVATEGLYQITDACSPGKLVMVLLNAR